MSLKELRRRRDAAVVLGPKMVPAAVYEAALRSQSLERELDALYSALGEAFAVEVESFVEGAEGDSDGGGGAEPGRGATSLRRLVEENAHRRKPLIAGKQLDLFRLVPSNHAIGLADLARVLHGEPVTERTKTAARKLADKVIEKGLLVRVEGKGGKGTEYRRTEKGRQFERSLNTLPADPPDQEEADDDVDA